MALNLSTLTNASTSASILNEALTTADFLDPVPILKNLSRGSNKGGDAKQTTALNQPKALPLIDGDGYLYVPDVVSNTCSTPDDSSLDITGDITIDIDLTLKNWNDGTERNLVSKYLTSSNQRSYRLFVTTANRLSFVISSSGVFESGGSKTPTATISFPDNQRAQIRVQWRSSDGRVQFFTSTDKGQTFTQLGTDLYTSGITSIYNGTADLDIGHRTNLNRIANSGIHSVQIYDSVTPSSSSLRFNCDFTATNVRHNDTKFACATGQVVTINQSGNDPATIIKKSVLRFANRSNNTTGICLQGLFNQTITDGYMFAAFSVLGDGGEGWGRVFSVNSTGSSDAISTGFQFVDKFTTSNDLVSYYNGDSVTHIDLFDENNGDILVESKITSTGIQSKVNDSSPESLTVSTSLSAEEFNISTRHVEGIENPAIDLEYLAVFPATITDAEADSVRNYINKRNNVFSLIDSQGYYFYDAQKAPVGAITTGSASWNGRIVGSDFGDTDKFATQGTTNEEPVADGYVVTFADNVDHLEITQVTQAGWQVVGTSLGTFAYRVDNDAVTELTLLGNANTGATPYRQTGDLYGIILLPESATGADIEAARKLLIDRGAADGVSVTNLNSLFRVRRDIVEFGFVDTSGVTNFSYCWPQCSSMLSFPSIDTSNGTNFSQAWIQSGLQSFPPLDMRSGTNFSYAWQGCSALTSFSAGAKLGTSASASNVDFSFAWNSSGLTSFPALDLSKGNNFLSAWRSCSALTSFPSDALLGTEAENVIFNSAWRVCTSLTSFSSNISSAISLSHAWYGCSSLSDFRTTDIKNCTNFTAAWQGTTALTSFPAGAKLGTSASASNVNFSFAWRSSGLLSFPALDLSKGSDFEDAWRFCDDLVDFPPLFTNWNPQVINSAVFHDAWDACPALSAESVGNILQSIDASGQYATVDGESGSNAISVKEITIDYDGTTLSAATNTAIDSLSGKGWEVYINGVLVIPNILDLAPAAAYSLRSFDANADPNVVKVRRSSDGALSNFKASEVSDGTLTDWVNTEYNIYTSDFSSSGGGWVAYLGTITPNVDSIGGRDDCLRYVENEDDSYHFVFKTQQLLTYDRYRLSAEVYLPSSNTQIDELKVLNGLGDFVNIDGSNSTTSTDEWITISFEATRNTGSNGHRVDFVAYTNGGRVYAGNGTDTFYVRNIQIDQLTADGHVTTWNDQREIVETGSAYGTTISGTVDGTNTVDNQIAPAVAGEFYRVRFTASNLSPRGRLRYRNYAGSADVAATAGLGSMTYFYANGDYEAYVPSDDGLSLYFYADVGQSFDYSEVSVQQVAEVPNDASQPLVSNMPLLVDGGTLVTEGGLAAVDFDGVDDYLAKIATFTINGDHLMTAVHTPLQGYLFSIGYNDNQSVMFWGDSGNYSRYWLNSSADQINSGETVAGQRLTLGEMSSGSQTLYIDGTQNSTKSTTYGGGDVPDITIGYAVHRAQGANYLNGKVQELIFFNTDQSANRTGIEKNINDHFTIYS